MAVVDICIGIISYLPDDKDVRRVRIDRLNNLLKTINKTFNLPVLIIAQNWNDNEINFPDNQIHKINKYEKLGITLARETLRKVFINETNYSHIICLDDDFEISSNKAYAKKYKNEIAKNPNMFFEYGNFLMNLAVFPRDIFKENIFNIEIDAEKGTGFEDWIYMSTLQKKYPKRYKKIIDFGLSVHKRSELVNDKYSTWITSTTDKNSLDKASRNIINLQNRSSSIIQNLKRTQVNNVEKNHINNVHRAITNIKEIATNKNEKIDLVIPYINSKSPEWNKLYKQYRCKEDLDLVDTLGVSDMSRFRDFGTLHYLLRSIETNVKWINNVFLVVQDSTQLPYWLNTKYNKLKIVYHDEFIPEELLPTFNKNVIEMFLCNIKDLADNYILCHDDMFFMSPIGQYAFFEYNKPIYSEKDGDKPKGTSKDLELLNSEFNNSNYWQPHIQTSHKKSVELELMNKYKDKFINSFMNSKFMNENNYTSWYYNNYIKFSDRGIIKPNLYLTAKNITLGDSLKFGGYRLVCINDSINVNNFDIESRKLRMFLKEKFPNKSLYEK